MAKRKARGTKATSAMRRAKPARRSVKRPTGRARSSRKTSVRKKAPAPKSAVRKRPGPKRERRGLEDAVPTPPSSLNLNRHGSAARTGRASLRESLIEHGTDITPAITAGDVDADWAGAYFTGEEAPGGDNPTPDQDVVDDIGKALGVQYEDHEELKASDKVVERDKHRWELDPASSEDYKDRK